MITIHHIKETNVQADLHLYCGRKGSCKRTDLIDAQVGNPHPVSPYTCSLCKVVHQRGEACDAYHEMLLADLKHPHWPAIKRIGLRHNEGKHVALYCFCAPNRCHCESIKMWAEKFALCPSLA